MIIVTPRAAFMADNLNMQRSTLDNRDIPGTETSKNSKNSAIS